jgi:hypothetical protein
MPENGDWILGNRVNTQPWSSTMKKSARATLTIVAAVGCAVLRAQQASDPCSAANFNRKACKAAVKRNGYWSGCAWVPKQYQKYPYYYGFYRAYASGGGVVNAGPLETCRGLLHGGFGRTGAAASARHAGS